jgi:hypothetical protein
MKLFGLLLNFLLLGTLALSDDKALVSSLLIFYLLIVFFSVLVSSKGELLPIFTLLSVILPTYLLYSFITYNDDFGFTRLYYSDEGYFFKNISSLSNEGSIQQIWNKTIVQRTHRDYEGFFLFHGLIGYFGKLFFDSSTVALHSFWISFLGVLTNLFVFKVIRVFFPLNTSLKLILVFSLLSPMFYYTPWILRDIHIAFLYSVSFFLVLRRFSIINATLLFLIALMTIEIRVENGLFLLVFPVINLIINKYNQAGIRRFYPFIIIISILSVSFLISMKLNDFSRSADSLNSYSEFTVGTMNDGFGSKLYKLPFGVRQFAVAINSQLTPMPPWALIKGDSFFIAGFVKLVNTIFWSILLFFGMFSISKKGITDLPLGLKYIYPLVLIFLFLNTSNMTIRRVISIYPILFLFIVYIGSKIPSHVRKVNMKKSVILYGGLIFAFFILKGVLA